jgi:hypothetical protein
MAGRRRAQIGATLAPTLRLARQAKDTALIAAAYGSIRNVISAIERVS